MKKSVMRFLLPVIIFVLVFAALPNTARAAGTVAVASSDFYTHQGETFTTTIYIPDDANIVDFDITLIYDTELVTLVNIEENEDVKGTVVFNADNEGEIVINYTRTSKNVTSYLPILDVTFTVDENIGVGVYECFSVDYNQTYLAHTLNSSGTLDEVEFTCNFAELVIYEMGDVDLTGKVDIGDATYIRRHLAGISGAILADYNLTFADTYYDSVVDIADAVCLQRHLARMNVLYGNRVNITFMDVYGNVYATKSVIYDGTLTNIPAVPAETGYSGGVWSLSAEEYIEPVFSNLASDMTLYAYYEGGKTSEAIEYYKRMLTDQYYSGDMAENLSSDLNLWSTLYYQEGYYANFIWNSDSNYVLNSTTGAFTKPTYPQELTLTVKIISYDANNVIEGEGTVSFTYQVPGEFVTPTKSEVADWINHYFTDETDNKYRVNYDVKLLAKLNNTIIPIEGVSYDNFEIRLHWYQVIDGVEVPISHIKRTTETQINDYVVVATFNGKPLQDKGETGGDGKIYIDSVEVTAIDQMEIKDYVITQISAMGTTVTDGKVLWNNDTVYGTNVTWETGNADIAYIANNVVELKDDAISGAILPLNARVSYIVDGGTEEFILSYNVTISCDNTKIKAPENMDEQLYAAIKAELEEELGYRGDLTSAALANVKFVNLDLSGYPEITSLRGLSYCVNLRTLNISGLHITDGTMNQISTLTYLEAFIARDCDLDNLSDGGTPVLGNAVRLKLLDLTNNNFTSLDSVFAEDVRYGALREVYLSNNQLTDINALQRAPLVTYLSLANNGLTTEGTAAIANYPYLNYLSLANNEIDSVTHLTGLKYLTELRLHNNNLTDVRGLRTLVNLEILYLGHNQIQDVGFLNTLAALEVLYVNDNLITDISQLSGLTKLEIINVNNNALTSLAVLRNYTSTLTEIYAENNKLTDFSFINGASQLRILMLAGNQVEIAQSNMTVWLSGLNLMEVLTLSDIRLTDLSFLDSMGNLVRLDIADCGLSAYTGDKSNIEFIANRYATLRILDLSNNDFRGYEEEILKLRNISLLTVLFADNICDGLDAYTLTYSMPELRYISLENCEIEVLNWLGKYNNLAYVDLAGSNISSVSFGSDISNASLKTLKELYLDTNVACSFMESYYTQDISIEKLSLEGVFVDKIENLPFLDNIKYLNLSNTGLVNLTGSDIELSDLYSIERYATVEVLDVSGLETDITVLENMPNLHTLYAVGATNSKLFYKENLHALQRMYNNGIVCYLYGKQTVYSPVAQTEGTEILDLLEDISCEITVAADNMISDNNPYLVDQINGYEIVWSVSNADNYEIVDNYLSVKDYTGIDDERLVISATICVYPNQETVSREFTINTSILRASSEYFNVDAMGYSRHLERSTSFTYDLSLKAAKTEGFTEMVKPVVDVISYSYLAVAESGIEIPYPNVLTVGENHAYTIAADAPLNATVIMNINVGHITKDGTVVNDVETISVPVTVASRTFTVTVVLNGGELVDGNGAKHETFRRVEDALIFEGYTVQRTGYLFEGWYTDAELTQLFSLDGSDAIMPSADISLYAKWQAHSFNLTFDANGGTVYETSRVILCDTAFGELPVPTRTGYRFDGWFTADGTQITASSTMATADDVTVYARWTLVEYNVSWNTGAGYSITVSRTSSPNANASTGILSNDAVVYYGDVLAVSYSANAGYSLSEKGSTSITVTGNVTSDTIYASATLNSYKVSWNTGVGYAISVKRTSSPNAGATTGALSNGETVYYGDVLSVTYTADTGYSLSATGSISVTVNGNVTSSTIYATATPNSYTYNIVYKSSNGTNLGTGTVTYKYGTTNTISPKSISGYTAPASQSITWDSTSAKTITFEYTPISVEATQTVKSGTWWTYSGAARLTYKVTITYVSRTADSVTLKVTWTNTIQKNYYYGYAQYGTVNVAGSSTVSTGKMTIASASKFGQSSNYSQERSSSVSYTMTVPLNSTAAQTLTVTGSWSDGLGKSGSWTGTCAIPAY